jgi:hypothetical protein
MVKYDGVSRAPLGDEGALHDELGVGGGLLELDLHPRLDGQGEPAHHCDVRLDDVGIITGSPRGVRVDGPDDRGLRRGHGGRGEQRYRGGS